MEFHEKLQQLRKMRGLTQEELAEILFVSRTAISKWESGRGYPSIDSLKAISKFFSVSIDDLLSGDVLLTIAEEHQKQKESQFRDRVFGLVDCSAALLFLLPLFADKAQGGARAVSLLGLGQTPNYLKYAFAAVVLCTVAVGVAALALQNTACRFWMGRRMEASILCSAVGVLLFVISHQPYAAVYFLFFLMMKAWLLIKRQ